MKTQLTERSERKLSNFGIEVSLNLTPTPIWCERGLIEIGVGASAH
jgi:hypothetical protein